MYTHFKRCYGQKCLDADGTNFGATIVTAEVKSVLYSSFVIGILSITYLLTPRCRVFLEKLTGLQLVKKFPAFYGTRRFITALTSVCYLSLSWASPIQSTYPHPTSWRSILILSTHLCLGLPSGVFPSSFPTKTLYTPVSSPIRATCSAHLTLLDFITRKILGADKSVVVHVAGKLAVSLSSCCVDHSWGSLALPLNPQDPKHPNGVGNRVGD